MRGGGRFTVDFSSSRLESSNQFARLNPQFPSALSATYTQPLFRGRAIDNDRRNILIARRAVDLTDAQLTQVVMDQLTLVEQAYWDVAFTVRNLEVLTAALEQARAQVASNERQSKEGTLAPIDVVEAQTQVARFQQAVASGQQALTEAENRLKRLILSKRSADAWNKPIVPADLADRTPPAIGVDDAVKLALTRRPELRALDSTLAQNAIDRAYFKNQTKPQVNVVGGYTIAGLAGDPLSSTSEPPVSDSSDDAAADEAQRAVDPGQPSAARGAATVVRRRGAGFFVGDYGTSLSTLFARRFPTAIVQLQMDIPLRNRTARANLARAEITATQIERRRQAMEQAIESDVRDTLQAVQSSQQRLEAAASSAALRARAVRERAAPLRFGHQHRVPRPRTADRARHRASQRAARPRRSQSGDRRPRTRRGRHARAARRQTAVVTRRGACRQVPAGSDLYFPALSNSRYRRSHAFLLANRREIAKTARTRKWRSDPMGSLGVPELVITLITVLLGLVPLVVMVWAVLTLREVQQSQNSIERRLEAIEQLIRQR